ncbi:MAG: DUF1460 domain-containing protein [Nitrospirae bacterium]|nr:DUF1460 domain-containing protein [Nitrospirota bacterium]
MRINIGRWTEDELDRIIREAAKIADAGERIALISEKFLGVAYQENTLIGDQHTGEELVIDLGGMDCFTFLDYIEAMRLSRSFSDVLDRLKQVRYRGGLISYRSRNHFFTDWAEYRHGLISDATEEIGPGKVKKVQKTLNRKDDETLFLNGIEPVDRTITFVPADEINEAVLQSLKTGDYAGIYSEQVGLDVSHVGIIIRTGASLFLRHASSSRNLRKTVDQDFMQYMKGKPGLVVLRPV